MYREMFSHHFPSPSAKKTVPSQGKSIACSTAAAIAWDASFENLLDPSGRAVGGVHDQVITKIQHTTIAVTKIQLSLQSRNSV